MTTKASGDFLRANDPGVLTRLETLEDAGSGAMTGAEIIAALGATPILEGSLEAGTVYAMGPEREEHVAIYGGNDNEGYIAAFLDYNETTYAPLNLTGTVLHGSNGVGTELLNVGLNGSVLLGRAPTLPGPGETNINNTFCARSVTLTAADLADLHNTQSVIAAAVPAKTYLLTFAAAVLSLNGGSAYSSTGAVPRFSYGAGATGPLEYSGDFLSGFADATEDKFTQSSTWTNGGAPASEVVGESLNIQAPAQILVPGAIVTSAIAAAGTGYVALETVTRGDATIRIDTVGGSGEVLTYTVTVAGTNNIIGTAQATTGGSGADFTVDITALNYSVNPMTLTIKILYGVMDV